MAVILKVFVDMLMMLKCCVAGMESECCSDSMSGPGLARCASPMTPASPYCLDSALPSDSDLNYDHHSSEEELEVINSSHNNSSQQHTQQLLRSRSASTVPEKRKWSQVIILLFSEMGDQLL